MGGIQVLKKYESMTINSLTIQNFRNLTSINIELHPHFNVFIGENGAGKTSILEALYFLSFGRSFRSNQLNRIIQSDQSSFTVFVKNSQDKIGISRHISGEAKLKLNGESLSSHVSIAQRLPVLLFNPESFQLFTEGSKPRRQLIDWGIFYQQSDFLSHWQQYKRALKQRNAALKLHRQVMEVTLWDSILIENADHLDQMRAHYVKSLESMLMTIIGSFMEKHGIELQYYRGWAKESDLQTVLHNDLSQDQQSGFTHHGPHRADLRLRVCGKPAQEILSRGQQKVLVCGLKLAQGLLLQQQTGKQSIYLLDDIASELDDTHRRLLLDYLKSLDAQVMMTSIDAEIEQQVPLEHSHSYQVSAGAIELLKTIC